MSGTENARKDTDFDVIVVGAGILGSACAYYSTKSNLRTLILEQYELAHGKGSSHGRSRIIRRTHSSEVYVPFSFEAFKEWDRLEVEFDRQLYRRNGLLWISDCAESNLKRAELLEKYSVPYAVLRGREISEKFSHLNYNEDKWTALWEPSGGTILADKCLGAFHECLQASSGCVVRQNERVFSVNATDERNVTVSTLSGLVFTARKVVVSAGPWMTKLIADLPLHVAPQHVAVSYWDISESAQKRFQTDQESPNLIISQYAYGFEAYMIPCTDHADKVKFGLHLGLEECDPDDFTDLTKQTAVTYNSIVSEHLTAHIKDLDPSAPSIEDRCFYTMTEDHHFILDAHPKYENIIIIGGMSGAGFKFAAIIGKIVANALVATTSCVRSLFYDDFKLNRLVIPKGKCPL